MGKKHVLFETLPASWRMHFLQIRRCHLRMRGGGGFADGCCCIGAEDASSSRDSSRARSPLVVDGHLRSECMIVTTFFFFLSPEQEAVTHGRSIVHIQDRNDKVCHKFPHVQNCKLLGTTGSCFLVSILPYPCPCVPCTQQSKHSH